MLRSSLAAAANQANLPEMSAVVDESVAGSECAIPIRRYRPVGQVKGTGIYFHAGGWVIGDLNTSDALCRRLAAGIGCEIISVDYRLAPENPYPAGLNDAYEVLLWVASKSEEPVVLIGESAGGNLAAACAILARNNSVKLAGQFLAYPVTDHNFNTWSYRQVGGCNYLLSEADMRWFWNHYCPPTINRDDPLVSPLRIESAAGLASALIYVAELDPLREEGLAYAARLAGEGVAVQTRCDKGMLHGYLSAAGAIPAVAEAVAQATAWLKKCIDRA